MAKCAWSAARLAIFAEYAEARKPGLKSTNNSTKSKVNTNANEQTKYFLSGPSCDTDKRKSDELSQQIHKEFNIAFNGIGCLEGTFS